MNTNLKTVEEIKAIAFEGKSMTEIAIVHEELCGQYTAAHREKAYEVLNEVDKKIAEAESAYKDAAKTACFTALRNQPDVMLSAVLKHDFETISHKDEENDVGNVTREQSCKTIQIDLYALHKFCDGGIGHDKLWRSNVESFNKLLCLRTAKELNYSNDQIKEIDSSYAMSKNIELIDMGKTPTSNTQLLKCLQKVIDAMIYEENPETGENKYKALSHDVRFLIGCYTKKGKKALSLATSKHTNFCKLIADVALRIATDGCYSIEYQRVKDAAAQNGALTITKAENESESATETATAEAATTEEAAA